MTVGELRERLAKEDDDLEVIIEADKGRKFRVLTAKERHVSAGHKAISIFWIATGKEI